MTRSNPQDASKVTRKIAHRVRRAIFKFDKFHQPEELTVRFTAFPDEFIEAILAFKPQRSKT
jgi:hypothetical protein